jgi:hypothetical protein
MTMTNLELRILSDEVTLLRRNADEAERKLCEECTHPEEDSEFDGLGMTCGLCGSFEYDLGVGLGESEEED